MLVDDIYKREMHEITNIIGRNEENSLTKEWEAGCQEGTWEFPRKPRGNILCDKGWTLLNVECCYEVGIMISGCG